MFRNELIKVYAIMDCITYEEAARQYRQGAITDYELFDTWLKYEGIFGYTDKIITSFRECFLKEE